MSAPARLDIYLHPGEWYFGGRDTLIHTLLGSCVSITLWHPLHRLGGMCHYMLPTRGRGQEHTLALSGRYADEAILLLLQQVLRSGLPLREFHAKLIGAAGVLTDNEMTLSAAPDVAANNMAQARQLADQLGLNLKANDLGGTRPRLVWFDLDSGDVWVRHTPEPAVTYVNHTKRPDK